MVKCLLKISMLAILGALIISTFSCCKPEVMKPIDTDTTKVSTFKVSATISSSSSTLNLGGTATGTINLKNDSLSPIRVSLTARITNFQLIDSIFIDGSKIDFPNGRLSFSKLIASSSTTTINYKLVVKQNLTAEQTIQNQMSSITIDTISFDGQTQSVSVSAPLFTLNLLATAFVSLSGSQASSMTAIDTFVVGKSVAEGFNLNVSKAGTAMVEVIGLKSDNSLPLSHYWITNSTDEDFGVRVSNFNSNNNVIQSKTAINSKSFTINLVAGVNNVVFKTTSLYKAIPNGSKVGLKITLANGITYTSLYDVKSDSVDLADKVAVLNSYISGTNVPGLTSRTNQLWSSFSIYPLNADNSFTNNFPKIVSMGISTEFYANKYKDTLDFTNQGNQSFIANSFNVASNDYINISNNFNFNLQKNYIKVNCNPYLIQKKATASSQSGTIALYLNVYNRYAKAFSPQVVGLDPYKGGWKFYGNPEMEIRVNRLTGQTHDFFYF